MIKEENMEDNWLKNAADLESKLEKAEYQGYINGYKHCLKLCDQLSFTSMSNGKVIRLSNIEPVLEGLIRYYEKEIGK